MTKEYIPSFLEELDFERSMRQVYLPKQYFLPGFGYLWVCPNNIETLVIEEKTIIPKSQILLPFYPVKLELL